MTIMQNALHSFGGDWSLGAAQGCQHRPGADHRARHRSFWLDGTTAAASSWQRFIARLSAHGRVNTLVPGSMLQTAPGDYVILGRVAQDVEIHMT